MKKEKKQKIKKEYREQETDAGSYTYDSSREIRWEKLDNTAHLFPAIAGEGMTNVYRVAIYLKEEIVRETLQEALDLVLPKFSVFNCRLRQGFFWYYFEENGKQAPTVAEETTYPCQYMEEKENRNYLFRVTYYGCRINLEAFHVLTDGTGAFYFLKELAYQYLRLAHPELREKYGDGLSSQTSLNTEDSFLQNFKKGRITGGYKAGRAYILKGPLFPTGKMGIIHGHMPVEEVKREAKKNGATLNEYMVAVFLWAVYQVYLKGMPSGHQLSVSVPVNLRPYFHSVTTKNFFVMVTAIFHPREENQTFENVLEAVKTSLREQMTKEHLEDVLSYNVTRERTMILRALPLVLKNPGIRGVYNMHARANTATVTNMGNIQVSEKYKEYISRFDVLLSRSKGQNLKLALSSYDGTLSATITSAMKDTRLQRVFFRYLAAQDITVTIESNGVYYE
ncbi:MAG: hypothetical protein LUD14_10180 [Clostridiales bacterium]|nr:hypothetical protein [Clostridiales bacterium]